MVVIGNKSDVDIREVTPEEGKELAKSYSCPYLETSAKTRTNIEEAFYTLVREIRKEKDNPSQEKKINKKKKLGGLCSIL